MEIAWQNADHGSRAAVQCNLLADDRRIAMELQLPDFMAQEHTVGYKSRSSPARKVRPITAWRSKHLEELRSHPGRQDGDRALAMPPGLLGPQE